MLMTSRRLLRHRSAMFGVVGLAVTLMAACGAAESEPAQEVGTVESAYLLPEAVLLGPCSEETLRAGYEGPPIEGVLTDQSLTWIETDSFPAKGPESDTFERYYSSEFEPVAGEKRSLLVDGDVFDGLDAARLSTSHRFLVGFDELSMSVQYVFAADEKGRVAGVGGCAFVGLSEPLDSLIRGIPSRRDGSGHEFLRSVVVERDPESIQLLSTDAPPT